MPPATDIKARLDEIVPGYTGAVLAEVARHEAVVLADRCAGRPCPEKDMGGTCADCPTEHLVFGEYLPEEWS